jgi:SAM-dependent methyltransferase
VTQLVPLPSRRFARELFARRITELAQSRGRIDIIEAGCGRRWNLALDGVDYRLIGIDIDEDALRARGDLDECIVADLRTVTMEPSSCDVVYCAFVLEHVEGAQAVLDRLVEALRPGGLLILRFPDRDTVWGFVARTTPFRLHVLYRRWIAREKNAGKPGHAPYPTVYDEVVSCAGVTGYAGAKGLEIVDSYKSGFYLDDIGSWRVVVDPIVKLIAALSRGRLTADHSDLDYVLRKPS